MKTNTLSGHVEIVSLESPKGGTYQTLVDADKRPDVARARAFAEPFISGVPMLSGEDTLEHSDAVAQILKDLQTSESLQVAAYLVYAVEHIQHPQEVLEKAFGASMANLVIDTHRLIQVQRSARKNQQIQNPKNNIADQTERARKMLLAFSRDLRGVLLRLSSRLQSMRYSSEHHIVNIPRSMVEETLHVFAPLASRLGIWQIKWELEDLSFRFLEPQSYHSIASQLHEKRIDREHYVQAICQKLENGIHKQLHIQKTQVTGRPKHIYSIWKKMQGKSLHFSEVYDLHAFRILVPEVEDCYTVLNSINECFEQIPSEFDDYIAKPKLNGYQSIHIVAIDQTESGRSKNIEIQIRTFDMHERAESGVAAHWAYKEAGTKGYNGVVANTDYDTRIAMLRQLLAWERDLAHSSVTSKAGLFEDRIYVLTPMATLIELPQGSTPLDFAYTVHTDLGHRCRGAKVDGIMVPLDTALQNGQTVEIISSKDGGPSRDWLNPDAHYLASPRAKAKVRAWFNAQIMQDTIAHGREQVEKLLQREGKTSFKLDDLASKLGFKSADHLFEQVGKDEYSLRHIELLINPEAHKEQPDQDSLVLSSIKKANTTPPKGGVLVVGIESLLTQLAKCCKPAPPDPIIGYVTRGKGVSVHRADCSNVQEFKRHHNERVIDVQWGNKDCSTAPRPSVYPVDIEVWASDRQGLLRDISEVLAKEQVNVIGVKTQSIKSKNGDNAWMVFTVEISDTTKLQHTLNLLIQVRGVKNARRR